jgi:hypothetical protein
MAHRYWLHWYADARAPATGGRELRGGTVAAAIKEADSLIDEGAHPSARTFVIIDTDEGDEVWRRDR